MQNNWFSCNATQYIFRQSTRLMRNYVTCQKSAHFYKYRTLLDMTLDHVYMNVYMLKIISMNQSRYLGFNLSISSGGMTSPTKKHFGTYHLKIPKIWNQCRLIGSLILKFKSSACSFVLYTCIEYFLIQLFPGLI